jgi:hypothetical protein
MVTGIVPHVGGPVMGPCMPTVLTMSLPQARITDMAVCVGPPDVIVMGSATVLVGGLPAARVTDLQPFNYFLAQNYRSFRYRFIGARLKGSTSSYPRRLPVSRVRSK